LLGVPAKRFAMVGCGAIAESFFLPALTSGRDFCSGVWIVDSNPDRLAATAQQFAIPHSATELESVIDEIDAAVIATPHDTHYGISQTLIAAGKHVLCEKPMTVTPDEGADMVSAADRAGVVLMANNWRRICPAFVAIKDLIAGGRLGTPINATWYEGKKFDWPTSSGFYFTQRSRHGLPPPGILLDIGAHVVDLLCWWYGTATVVDCRTDSFGGPEARASLSLNFAGVPAKVELTYYQKLTNRYTLLFERGVIHGNTKDPHRFVIHEHNRKPKIVSLRRNDPANYMLRNFVRAIAGQDQPMIPGRDVLPSITAIFTAYQKAQPYDAPWLPRF
jgi:predicted dehydrogenase